MSKYAWIGAFVGFGIVWFVLKIDAFVPGLIGGFVGAAIGEIIWQIEKYTKKSAIKTRLSNGDMEQTVSENNSSAHFGSLNISQNGLDGSIGIEALGGKSITLINDGTDVPCLRSEIFSTSTDNQEEIEFNLFQGNSSHVSENVLIGTYKILGIPHAPKSIPRIEVTFSVLEDGSLAILARNFYTKDQMEVTVVE
jgi:hypothetical protein